MGIMRPVSSAALLINNYLADASILSGSDTPINGYSLDILVSGGRSDRVLWYSNGSYIRVDFDLATQVRPTAFFIIDVMHGPWDTNQRFRQEVSSYDRTYSIWIYGADDSSFTTNVITFSTFIDLNGKCVAYLGNDQNAGQYNAAVKFGPLIANSDGTTNVTRYTTSASAKIDRILANGTLDTTYGTAGTYTTGTIGSGNISINRGLNGASTSVFVGQSAGAGGDMVIFRLNSSYVLDTSFNTNGYITFTQDDASKDHAAYGVCSIESTKYIVAGHATSSANLESFAFTKINSNGTIDTAFGTSGHKLVNGFASEYGAGRDDRCLGVSSDTTTNKIVGVGKIRTGGGSTYVAGMCQMSSTGVLDSGFGTGGLKELNLGYSTPRDVANCVAHVGSSGDFLVGGYGRDPSSGGETRGWVARITNTGAYSSTFAGGDVLVFNDLTLSDDKVRVSSILDMAISGEFAYILATGTRSGASVVMILKMYSSTGLMDISYGDSLGIACHYMHSGGSPSAYMFLTSSGECYISYYVSSSGSIAGTNGMVVKFTANGTVDSTFGSGNIAAPKRYWRVEWINDAASADQMPNSASKIYIGDYVNLRPGYSTSINLIDNSKSDQSWNGNEYTDRVKPYMDVSVDIPSMTSDEVYAILDYCVANGAHSFGLLDLAGPESDISERSDSIVFGNLDERSGFVYSRKMPTLYDGKIKFIEDPQ